MVAIRPYIEYQLYAQITPRPVETRGELADYEKATINVFERVSPSVVQIVGRGPGNAPQPAGAEEGARSGTGFLWDRAGHVVTNDHVVQGTSALAVRLASGQAVCKNASGFRG